MSNPIITAKTASGNTTGNTKRLKDTVIIIFDLPFDNTKKESFELSWGGKKLLKSLPPTESIDFVTATTSNKTVLAIGHLAIRFEKLKTGTYKLTRNDGRSDPDVIFNSVPKMSDNNTLALTNSATDLRDEPHHFWTVIVPYHESKDPDLKGVPTDVTALPVPEPPKGV